MAIGTISAVAAGSPANNSVESRYSVPVSRLSVWQSICTDVTATDNSAATVLKPSAITRPAQNQLDMHGAGTQFQCCLKYATGVVTGNVVVQAFGIDANGVPRALTDASGNSTETLTIATTTDAQDANGYSYTAPFTMDAQAHQYVMVVVKTTSLTGATTSNAALMVAAL